MSNSNKEMINKFKDYADCADASYAKLHYVYENIDSILNLGSAYENDICNLWNLGSNTYSNTCI